MCIRDSSPSFHPSLPPSLHEKTGAAKAEEEAERAGVTCSISLRVCYAMSGTDIAYAALFYLPTPYNAISLRDVQYYDGAYCYRPTRCPAMSGADLAYGVRSGGSEDGRQGGGARG
eukprot:3122660-Rhodomonas_salina.3